MSMLNFSFGRGGVFAGRSAGTRQQSLEIILLFVFFPLATGPVIRFFFEQIFFVIFLRVVVEALEGLFDDFLSESVGHNLSEGSFVLRL